MNEQFSERKLAKKWRSFNDECPHCGCSAEVMTSSGEDGLAYSCDVARCTGCGCHGLVNVSGYDDGPAYIDWDEFVLECGCELCKESEKNVKEEISRLNAAIATLTDKNVSVSDDSELTWPAKKTATTNGTIVSRSVVEPFTIENDDK